MPRQRAALSATSFYKKGNKNVKKKNKGIKRENEDVLISGLKAVNSPFAKRVSARRIRSASHERARDVSALPESVAEGGGRRSLLKGYLKMQQARK
jgi:hypothetical protein